MSNFKTNSQAKEGSTLGPMKPTFAALIFRLTSNSCLKDLETTKHGWCHLLFPEYQILRKPSTSSVQMLHYQYYNSFFRIVYTHGISSNHLITSAFRFAIKKPWAEIGGLEIHELKMMISSDHLHNHAFSLGIPQPEYLAFLNLDLRLHHLRAIPTSAQTIPFYDVDSIRSRVDRTSGGPKAASHLTLSLRYRRITTFPYKNHTDLSNTSFVP